MQTYLFYDIETTGLNKAFDQIVQFAGIRTDLNLQEIERYEIHVQLRPDVIPSPTALITHQIDFKTMSSGLSEWQAVKQIHQWLNQPGTISIGYNSLGFDDEFLRFSFYRNLLPPYSHQFANACSRMDLYPIAVMFYLFKHHCLQWPERDGKISLKLELLNALNQLADGQAHNAMVDVEATVALAKLFFKEKEMWQYIAGYFNKKVDQDRLQVCQKTPALWVDGFLGADQRFQAPVLYLGNHAHYKNQLLWLRLDIQELGSLAPDTLMQNVRVLNKKLGEPSFVLPMKERFYHHLNIERRTLADLNYHWLRNNPRSLAEITEYYTQYQYPVFPETDSAARLYLNGFWSATEEGFCRAFHTASASEKAKLTEQVTNPTLKTLAIRILGAHFPDVLTGELLDEYKEYIRLIRRMSDENGMIDFQGKPKLTTKAALSEVGRLRETVLTDHQVGLLDQYEAWMNRL